MWNLLRGWRSSVRYAALSALALSAGSLAAGCQGGSPAPSALASASHSAPASTSSASKPSPSPSPSYSVPPEARTHDEVGAMAFVRYFIEQSNLAWTKPDTTLIPPLSDDACGSCRALQKGAEELARDGNRVDQDPIQLISVAIRPGAPDGQLFMTAQLHQPPAKTIDRSGAVVDTQNTLDLKRQIGVIWKRDRWLMYGLAE